MRFICFAALAVALATPAIAQDQELASENGAVTVSGGAALVSQYRFRGIGLSDEKPAVQGWMNLNHDSGVYVGAWASSIDGFGELGGSNLELDLYGGYKAEISDGVTLDAGLLYYAYPGSPAATLNSSNPMRSLGWGLARRPRHWALPMLRRRTASAARTISTCRPTRRYP